MGATTEDAYTVGELLKHLRNVSVVAVTVQTHLELDGAAAWNADGWPQEGVRIEERVLALTGNTTACGARSPCLPPREPHPLTRHASIFVRPYRESTAAYGIACGGRHHGAQRGS